METNDSLYYSWALALTRCSSEFYSYFKTQSQYLDKDLASREESDELEVFLLSVKLSPRTRLFPDNWRGERAGRQLVHSAGQGCRHGQPGLQGLRLLRVPRGSGQRVGGVQIQSSEDTGLQ